MEREAEIAAAVLAEREACLEAVSTFDPLAAATDWDDGDAIAFAIQRRARSAIQARPAPATDALDRALRACAIHATEHGDHDAAIAAGRAALGGGA